MIDQLVRAGIERLASPEAVPLLLIAIFTAVIGPWSYRALVRSRNGISKFPLVNGRKPWSLFVTEQKMRFSTDSKNIIAEGLRTAGDIFRLQTDDGIQLVYSGDHADSLKDNADLNFGRITAEGHHAHIPGFEPFHQGSLDDEILQNAVKLNLTQALSRLNIPLSEEAAFALKQHWTDNPDWHEVTLKPSLLRLISQLSSRVFLGTELCRDEDWLRLSMDYSVDAIIAAQELRLWPKALRNYVHWFLPSCRKIRKQIAACRNIVNPVLERRRQAKAARVEQGLAPEEFLDGMEWMEQAAKGREYDPAVSQVMLSMAANFSGSDSLTQVLYDLCDQPQLVADLRREIVQVMTENQWNKSTIYKLTLMDSVLKESQRLKPAAVGLMRRQAVRDTILPDGTFFPKGAMLMVSAEKSWDESVFPNANKFDGYRFHRMREQGNAETSQFVSVHPSTLGFGYGRHACPGRFFAANELKIALSHILLKYDFKLAPDVKPKSSMIGLFWQADGEAKMLIRRREAEIEL